MKKLLIVLLFTVTVSVTAQNTLGTQYQVEPTLQGFATEGYLQDHDSLTMVRCSQWLIKEYMNSKYHQEPLNDGLVRMHSCHPSRGANVHECHSDNKLAQEVYLARLDRLRSVSLKPLSLESEAIVYNFELLTGTKNSIDHNPVGTQYVSSMALTAWKLWFNKHKEHLRICPITRVLYIDTLETLSE